MESKKEFEEADKRFNKMEDVAKRKVQELKSNIQMKKKIFMKISDVDVEDAQKFKDWCDRYTDGKQFLGIKVLMAISTNIEPLVVNIINQLNDMDNRLNLLEGKEQRPSLAIPKTQGGKNE